MASKPGFFKRYMDKLSKPQQEERRDKQNAESKPVESAKPEALEPIRIERLLSYRAAAMQQQGTRPRQEDSYACVNADDVTQIKNRGLLAIVADGMGGLQDGKVASEMTTASVCKDFEYMDRNRPFAPQLHDSAVKANSSVYARFGGQSGTTLIACIIYREMLNFVSVGDSYLYLSRGGKLYRLNRDQNYKMKLYRDEIRRGGLSRAKADADADGHRLSEFIGSKALGDIDMLKQPMRLEAGDSILICSDGVGGVLDTNELSECMEATNPSAVCDMIRQKVIMKKRQHQDNFTALVIQCTY
ncbi:MAG: serine/threonine-protein phosphatase [Clostridia bacterium]|nr:serine/threonine-protein phosphatase [Clostridia bacterium]